MTDKTGASGKKGGKGGSGTSRAAVEAQNTLQSRATARVIDIISHGECVGLANRGNPLRSIFYDGLPIENSDGTTNWQGVEVQERRGLPSQDPFVGFNEVEEEQVANVEVTTLTPRTIRVTDNTTDALRIKMRIPSLTKQNKDNGDLNGTQVAYKIESRVVGGSWAIIANEYLNDKCTTPQELSYRVEKPETAVGDADWEVKVTRLTPDTTDVTLQNKTFLASATKLIDAKLRYSDFAAVASLADSKQFGDSIPARSFDFVGMVLDVPSNYIAPDYDNPNDQSRRQYVGLWDGTFKRAWTDNPAWILWGLLTDKDWGLGRLIKPHQVDKWELYQIALYCDQFVSDGYGGFEPRYTINTQITKQDSAYGMLQAIASTFRGMLFWSSGSVSFVADQPKDPIKLVSPANVIDGEFSYTGTSLKNRHSVVRVSWNDPSDTFKQAIEVVEDPDMIDRYGYKVADITAYGCTSRAQAIRMGRWFLDTERYETETVTYRASFDHADVRPGQIIEIYDPHYAGVRMGGRITAVTATSVTLDAPVELQSGQTYSISLVRADGSLVTKNVTTSATPSTTTLSWSGSLSTLPTTGSAVIFSTALPTQRSTVVVANGANVTLENDIEINPAYSYYIGFTLPDGSITNRQITQASVNSAASNNGKLRSFTLTTPLSTLPAADSVAFVYVPSEGFTQRSVTSHTPTSATINSSFTIKAGYDYEVMLSFSDGSVIYRKLTNAAANATVLTWTEPTASLPVLGSMWGLTATNLAPRQFRVLGVKEVDQHLFEVTGLNYDQNKYDRIESGIVIEPSPDTIYTSTKIPNPPKNLQAYRRPVTIDGVLREKIYIFWDSSDSEFVTHYKIQVRKDDGELFDIPNSYSPSAELESRGSGDYTFVVRAVNIANKESAGLITTLSLTDERPLEDPILTNLTVEGKPTSNSEWTGSDLKVTWDVLAPSNWWNPEAVWEDPYLKDYEVTVKNAGGTILGKFYTTDKSFVLGKERSAEINGGVPLRVANITVKMRDIKDALYGSIAKTFSNPAPLAPTQVILAQTAATVTITVPKCPDLDYSSTKVWISTTNNFNPVSTAPTYDAQQTQFAFSATPNTTYYVRVAYTDDFSSSNADLNISTQYSVDAAGIGTGDIDTTPPAVPTGLALNSNVKIDAVSGDAVVTLVATWNTNGEADIGTYETELTVSGGFPVVEVSGNNRKEWTVTGNTTYSVRLRAVDRVGNRSAFTSAVSHTTIKDAAAPSAPTGLSAKALFSSVALAWTNASASDLRSVRVYENSTNNSGTATLIATVDARPSSAGYYVRDDVAPGATRYYWLVSVDGSGNASGFSSSVTATSNGIGNTDFTPGIVAIETVASLPTSGNTKDRTVRFNDKLYTWTSSTVSTGTQYWKTGVDSSDISGTISNSQIADLDAAKIIGQLGNGQIADLAASKITGQLTNDQIAGIAAAKLTGTITETQISDSAISSPKIAAGAVIAGKLAANSVSADNVIANTIGAKHLIVTDWTNLVANGDVSSSNLTMFSVQSGSTLAYEATDGYTGSARLAFSKTVLTDSKTFTQTNEKSIRVAEGEVLYAEWVYKGSAAASAGAYFRLEWLNEDYSNIAASPNYSDVLSNGAITTSWVVAGKQVTVPAGAKWVKARVYNHSTNTTASTLYIGYITIRRANSAQLIVDGSITANKILAGTITGDKIAANAITTSKLYVGDTTNVFTDANQAEPSLWSLNTAPDAYTYRHNSAYASDFVWRIPASATVTKTMYSPLVVVDPGKPYFFSIVAALTGAANGGGARVTFDWYYYEPQTGNLSYVGGDTIANNTTSTQSKYTGIWSAPANANRLRLLYTRDPGGTADALFIEPIIRRASSGELIVDGAITANKIQAGTITGDRIQAGTISTSLLAAQAITVDKLAVTSMDNLIANGMFQSDVQGDFPAAWSRYNSGGGSGSVQVVKGGASWPVPAAVRLRRNTASSVELSAVADRYGYEDAAFYEKGGFLAAPGDEFYVESYVYSDAANIARIEALGKTVTGGYTSEFTLQDLAFSSVNQNTVNINTSGWVKSVWTFRYNGAMTAKVALRFWNLSSTATHEVYFGNILVRRRNNGQLIVDGAITTNKILAGTITADRIQSGAITSTQIAAGTIKTSNLTVVPSSIFPDPEFMELGTDMWPTVQGWYPEGAGGGNIPQNIGIRRGMILWSGAGTVSGRFHIFSKWMTGLTAGQVIRLRVVGFNSSNQYMTAALHFRNSATGAEQYPSGVAWNGTEGGVTKTIQNVVPSGCDQYRLVIYNEGDNTFNGVLTVGGIDITIAASADMLVDGTITASKIVAGSITGDRIAANTITGNQIASQSITTRNLAIGNFNNIIPDGDYQDPQWWKRGGGSGATLSRIALPDGNWSQSSGLLFSPNDSGDVYSEFFPVEPGATYKVTFRVWKNDSGANGFFAPFIHMPGYMWLNLKKSAAAGTVVGGNPGYDGDSSEVWFGGTDTGDTSFMMFIPSNVQKNIQFRFRQSATIGNVIFQCRIVRVSDATLIADGSITTNKIQANSIDADRLRASNITVGLNVGSSGKIRLDGTNNRIVISD